MQNHTGREEATLAYTLQWDAYIHRHQLIEKFTITTIKAYNSQYNKNMIHNLSNHILTEE